MWGTRHAHGWTARPRAPSPPDKSPRMPRERTGGLGAGSRCGVCAGLPAPPCPTFWHSTSARSAPRGLPGCQSQDPPPPGTARHPGLHSDFAVTGPTVRHDKGIARAPFPLDYALRGQVSGGTQQLKGRPWWGGDRGPPRGPGPLPRPSLCGSSASLHLRWAESVSVPCDSVICE